MPTDDGQDDKNMTHLDKMENEPKAILNVMIIGFHHKKGNQVDFCYPSFSSQRRSLRHSFSEETSLSDAHEKSTDDDCDNSLPEEWSCLPSLSLPDGAHNFSSDCVFFHLPMPKFLSLKLNPQHDTRPDNLQNTPKDHLELSDADDPELVYGISCYRQIVVTDDLKEKDASVTRGTVIKAVVVLSRLPFYGLIAAKADSITRVYFNQSDFSQKSCLVELYNNLNFVLSETQRQILSPVEASLLALSPSRYLLTSFGHKILVLFKLILLEKKVLFFSTAPSSVSSSSPAASSSGSSPTQQQPSCPILESPGESPSSTPSASVRSSCLSLLTLASLVPSKFSDQTKHYHLYCNHCMEQDDSTQSQEVITSDEQKDDSGEKLEKEEPKYDPLPTDDDIQSDEVKPTDDSLPALRLFRKGYHLHPYLCLSYIDYIPEYRSCLVGATNGLFKLKKSSYFDATIDPISGKIEFEDPNLKKILSLSTEDLRFADFICRHALSNDLFNEKKSRKSLKLSPSPSASSFTTRDPTDFEGSDVSTFMLHVLNGANAYLLKQDWLRIQFSLYLLHALRSSFAPSDSKEYNSFNHHFMKNWINKTENYKEWKKRFFTGFFGFEAEEKTDFINRKFKNIRSGHPFSSSKSSSTHSVVHDMKLRFFSNYGNVLSAAASSIASVSAAAVTAAGAASVGSDAGNSGSMMSITSTSPSELSPDEKDQKVAKSKKSHHTVIEAGKSVLFNARSTFTSWISADQISDSTSTDEKVCSDTNDPDKSCDGVLTGFRKEFNSVSLSSLMRKCDVPSSDSVSSIKVTVGLHEDEEDGEEVVFTRPDSNSSNHHRTSS